MRRIQSTFVKSSGMLKVGLSEEYWRRGNDVWARFKEEEGGRYGETERGVREQEYSKENRTRST